MFRLSMLVILLIVALSFNASAKETVYGTVLRPGAQFEFMQVRVVDTLRDEFFNYWVGEVRGSSGFFLYDPYNRIWVPGPIRYEQSVLPFGHVQVEGWVRIFGDGMYDSRYFFGNNGHVYWRFDKYRLRRMQTDRRKKFFEYSFWLDLETGYRGPAYRHINGELVIITADSRPEWDHDINIPLQPPPTDEQLDQEAKNALAENAFPSWDEVGEELPEISEEPLTEEEQTSLGSLIEEVLNEGESEGDSENEE